MRSRNYTNEIGVNAAERRVPTAVALAILGVAAAVVIFLVRQVFADQPAHHETAGAPAPIKVSSR